MTNTDTPELDKAALPSGETHKLPDETHKLTPVFMSAETHWKELLETFKGFCSDNAAAVDLIKQRDKAIRKEMSKLLSCLSAWRTDEATDEQLCAVIDQYVGGSRD